MLAIVLPCCSTEVLHDLRAFVVDSADGVWLGAFGFARCPAESLDGMSLESSVATPDDSTGPWCVADEPLHDWTEMGNVFNAPCYADPSVPRCLKVVDGTRVSSLSISGFAEPLSCCR